MQRRAWQATQKRRKQKKHRKRQKAVNPRIQQSTLMDLSCLLNCFHKYRIPLCQPNPEVYKIRRRQSKFLLLHCFKGLLVLWVAWNIIGQLYSWNGFQINLLSRRKKLWQSSANLDIDSTPFIMSSISFAFSGSFCIFSKSWGLTVSDLPLLADEHTFPTLKSTEGKIRGNIRRKASGRSRGSNCGKDRGWISLQQGRTAHLRKPSQIVTADIHILASSYIFKSKFAPTCGSKLVNANRLLVMH